MEKINKYIEDMALSRDFNKGKSAKLFKKVHDSKKPLRVTKNGQDYVVIIDFKEYIKLVDKIYTIHPCRNAAFGLSHDTFFDSVGLAVLSC